MPYTVYIYKIVGRGFSSVLSFAPFTVTFSNAEEALQHAIDTKLVTEAGTYLVIYENGVQPYPYVFDVAANTPLVIATERPDPRFQVRL